MKPQEIFERVRNESRKNLTEFESREVLTHYGIPVVKGEIADSFEKAATIANKIGYPVVLKVISKDIIHKTDAGGVVLDVKNEKELKIGYNQILRSVKLYKPTAEIDGIFVQEMISGGYEVIIGGKADQTFGHVVLFGFGGIFVEIFGDVSFRIVPITKEDAVDMIDEIKAMKILKGYRGRKPADMDALTSLLLKTSKMLQENSQIRELDINPVFALHDKAIAGDARIIID